MPLNYSYIPAQLQVKRINQLLFVGHHIGVDFGVVEDVLKIAERAAGDAPRGDFSFFTEVPIQKYQNKMKDFNRKIQSQQNNGSSFNPNGKTGHKDGPTGVSSMKDNSKITKFPFPGHTTPKVNPYESF